MQRNTVGRGSESREAARRQIECRAVFPFVSISNSLKHQNAGIRGSNFQFLIPWFNTNFQTEPNSIYVGVS
jgi:hypothetical protein